MLTPIERGVSTMGLLLRILLPALLLLPLLAAPGAQAARTLDPAYADLTPLGPEKARGIVIYSHGRSLSGEDMESPSPRYLALLAKSGWDVVRFNRPSKEDRLDSSSADLAGKIRALKRQGYQHIVLAGHSFGGFLSLMAAAREPGVDAVLAIAPAAYGNYLDSYDTWQMNATELYRHLAAVHGTRVLLAFFHGDDYDPGGRADRSRQVLSRAGVPNIIIDQPKDLIGHVAGSGEMFMNRYGACIESFIENGGFACDTGVRTMAENPQLNGASDQ
jgi:pimeloyl-ACP methyl ester carboxylesterase